MDVNIQGVMMNCIDWYQHQRRTLEQARDHATSATIVWCPSSRKDRSIVFSASRGKKHMKPKTTRTFVRLHYGINGCSYPSILQKSSTLCRFGNGARFIVASQEKETTNWIVFLCTVVFVTHLLVKQLEYNSPAPIGLEQQSQKSHWEGTHSAKCCWSVLSGLLQILFNWGG